MIPPGTGIGCPASPETILGHIEAHDFLDTLDADIGHVAVHRERLGVVPVVAFQRGAVFAQDRRHFGVGDRNRNLVAIDDSATQPIAAIRQRQEVLTIGGDAQRRQPAEISVRRLKDQPTAKRQLAERGPLRFARIEGFDGLRVDFDFLKRIEA